MKYIFIVLLCLGSVGLTLAQSNRNASHNRVLNALLQNQQITQPAAKTTSGVPSERVIAQTTKDNVLGSLNDSITLKYGLSRSSVYDYNTMIYAYNYPYTTSPMFNYAGTFTKPQVLFDTLRHWTVNPNTLVYGYYETDMATYDGSQNLTTFKARYSDSAIYPNMNFVNRFNIANNIDSAYWFNFHGGFSDSAFKQFFTYNTSNLLTKDSIYELHLGIWRMVSKTTYAYNTANDLILIDNYANTTDTSFLLPLIEQLQYTNTFDASHSLLTVASSYYNGTSFGPYVRDTFAYTGAYTYHSSWKQYQWDPINAYWAPMFYMKKIINTSGLPDTVNIQGFDSILNAWIPQTMDVMHYNANHNPDTLKDYEYNFTSFPATPSFTTVYYYQPFLITTKENEVSAATPGMLLYPNPAKDRLNISQLNADINTPLTISVINAQGQYISRESAIWLGQNSIDIAALAPGNYWITVQNSKGIRLSTQAFIKE